MCMYICMRIYSPCTYVSTFFFFCTCFDFSLRRDGGTEGVAVDILLRTGRYSGYKSGLRYRFRLCWRGIRTDKEEEEEEEEGGEGGEGPKELSIGCWTLEVEV